ncbi:unnamed protein product, partial [Symbiodinium sp. CCMP2456]
DPRRQLLDALRHPTGEKDIWLRQPLRVAGWPAMARVTVERRDASEIALSLQPACNGTPGPSCQCCPSRCAGPQEASEGVPTLHCKVVWQETGEELCALRLLSLPSSLAARTTQLNARWAKAQLMLAGVPVYCPLYAVESLGLGYCLVEALPGVSLSDLKRTCGENTRTRVGDHLAYCKEKLSVLAATCAAMLAACYLLGAAAGDGDTLRILPDGSIVRTGFCGLFGGASVLDAPPVWLPQAVTYALGHRWSDVQLTALHAFRLAVDVLAPWPPENRLHRCWAKA